MYLTNGDSVLSEGLAVLSEHELGGSLVEGGVSIESGVLVIVLAADSSLSLSHGREDPGLRNNKFKINTYLSVVVTIGTDTENDLVGVLIGHELFLKKENGIGNRIFGLERNEEGATSLLRYTGHTLAQGERAKERAMFWVERTAKDPIWRVCIRQLQHSSHTGES